jgi:RluA family pseudouridine synthase
MGRRKASPIEIIYQDEDVLIVNKPAGASVTRDRSGAEDLPAMLARQLNCDTELRLVHRLDKDTSGVFVMARNLSAQSWLSRCFERQWAQKIYLAIVHGATGEQRGTIEAPIAEMPHERNRMQVARHGKEAVTDWELLADFGPVSLLLVRPKTGRTHQVRVHLASVGLPLAIDPTYGSSRPILLSEIKQGYKPPRLHEERPLIERLTLHAYQLRLPLREGEEPRVFVARLDDKFEATLKMLAKHNRRGFAAFAQQGILETIVSGKTIDEGDRSRGPVKE